MGTSYSHRRRGCRGRCCSDAMSLAFFNVGSINLLPTMRLWLWLWHAPICSSYLKEERTSVWLEAMNVGVVVVVVISFVYLFWIFLAKEEKEASLLVLWCGWVLLYRTLLLQMEEVVVMVLLMACTI